MLRRKGKTVLAYSALCSAEVYHQRILCNMTCILLYILNNCNRCSREQQQRACADILGGEFRIYSPFKPGITDNLPVYIKGIHRMSCCLESLGSRTAYKP